MAKWYTRIIGVFFTLVAISLISDYAEFGFRPETMHKVFHVLLGVAVLRFGWKNELWWKAFPLVNGAFFTFVALFGWTFPDFAGLDAFNRLDTVLHSIVGVSGIAIGLYVISRRPSLSS
ncbi:DUF4383 domain-containing protein [Candidatus Parcubacteria bacterium]|nr:MAG: DUF4383 domain-containing protein [Candidatus Parcubacteria bacterium]